MASQRTRPRADGTVTHAVLWRDPRTGTQTSMQFPTPEQAGNFRRILEAHNHDLAAAQATVVAVNKKAPSVHDAVQLMLAELSGVADRTRRDYAGRIAHHITPHLGAIPVESLTRAQLVNWQQLLVAKGLATRTIGDLHSLVSASLGTAVAHGWREDNPAKGMKIPRETLHLPHEAWFLTHAEYERLLGEIPGYHRPFIVFLAGTGLRYGEAVGADIRHIRLDARVPLVQVRQALHRRENGSTYIGPVKPGMSLRDVTLADQALDLIRMSVLGRSGDDPLFTGSLGKGRLYHAPFYTRIWQPAAKRAGLAGLRLHDLRHTHASWLIEQGVPLTDIQRRLGHSSIKVTSDTYGHLGPKAGQVSAEAISRAMAGR